MPRKVTLKERILDDLRHMGELTDSQLARRLEANEPSVRRARNQLVKAGVVCIASYLDRRHTGLTWRACWAPPTTEQRISDSLR